MYEERIESRGIIDERNDLELTLISWPTLRGRRYGFELAVAETDPFIEDHGDSEGGGFCSLEEAKAEAIRQWRSFRPGDELCRGVYKV